MQVRPLGQEDPLGQEEEGMATHFGIPAWRISWTEEPGGLQPKGVQRVRPDWIDLAHTHYPYLRFNLWESQYNVGKDSFKISHLQETLDICLPWSLGHLTKAQVCNNRKALQFWHSNNVFIFLTSDFITDFRLFFQAFNALKLEIFHNLSSILFSAKGLVRTTKFTY